MALTISVRIIVLGVRLDGADDERLPAAWRAPELRLAVQRVEDLVPCGNAASTREWFRIDHERHLVCHGAPGAAERTAGNAKKKTSGELLSDWPAGNVGTACPSAHAGT